MAVHAEIEPLLKTLLEKNGVPQEILDHMKDLECNSVSVFANWVEKKEDLKRAILDATPKKDDPSALARLKMAWRQAEAVVDRGVKRSSEGLTEEALDEPLDSGVFTSVNEAFKSAYNWPMFSIERRAADTLFGRIYREFQSCKITMFPVAKVKTAAALQSRQPATRRKLAESLSIVIENSPDDDEIACGSLLVFLELLEVLANTWGITGAFKVPYEGKDIYYVYWPDACEYVWQIQSGASPLLQTYTESSVLAYATSVEEAFRIKAIDLARGDKKMPFGIALKTATEKHSSYWDHKKDLLVRRKGPNQAADYRQAPSRSTPKGGKGGKNEGKSGGGKGGNSRPPVSLQANQSDFRRAWHTSRYDNNNNLICKNYNDLRGCRQNPCPWGNKHVCDIQLETGKVCGSSTHTRRAHRVSDHGQPKIGSRDY